MSANLTITAVDDLDGETFGRTAWTGVSAGGGSTLNNDLVSFWKLEEASGTRTDEISTHHLTTAGTVGNTTGKIGNAALFVGGTTSNYLSTADHAALSFTSSFTIACWINWADILAQTLPGIVTKWTPAGGRSYALVYDDAALSRLRFIVSSDGAATAANAVANNFGALTPGTSYFVVAYFDDANDVIGISVNDGTPNTAAFTGSVFDSTSELSVGQLGSSTEIFDGSIDAVGIWSRKLTSAEITELYNSGNGREAPF